MEGQIDNQLGNSIGNKGAGEIEDNIADTIKKELLEGVLCGDVLDVMATLLENGEKPGLASREIKVKKGLK